LRPRLRAPRGTREEGQRHPLEQLRIRRAKHRLDPPAVCRLIRSPLRPSSVRITDDAPRSPLVSSPAALIVLTSTLLLVAAIVGFLVYAVVKYTPIIGR